MSTIRLAKDADRERVMAIFNYYIEHSMAAYPTRPLPIQAWEPMKGKCIQGNLWVAEDENGHVCGFAMLKDFMGLEVFAHTADVGYFIDPEYTGKGLGKALLNQIEEVARSLGIKVLMANVSSLNPQSLAFHPRMGFTECGKFPGVGKKNGEIFDLIWFYKEL